jgi:hypothetical protein
LGYSTPKGTTVGEWKIQSGGEREIWEISEDREIPSVGEREFRKFQMFVKFPSVGMREICENSEVRDISVRTPSLHRTPRPPKTKTAAFVPPNSHSGAQWSPRNVCRNKSRWSYRASAEIPSAPDGRKMTLPDRARSAPLSRDSLLGFPPRATNRTVPRECPYHNAAAARTTCGKVCSEYILWEKYVVSTYFGKSM